MVEKLIGDIMLMYMDVSHRSDQLKKRSTINFENRWVLRSALNFASDGEVVREVGREFQRKGPEKAKADLAKECLIRVKKKREQEDDRKLGRLGLSLRHIPSDQAIIEERHRDRLGCKCDVDIKGRIYMAKNAYSKMKNILTNSKIRISTKLELLVLHFSCAHTALSPGQLKNMKKNINAAEMWFLKKIIKIS
ncbi:hypothetical protein HELRODRAFT_163861 [Helobdella robusta]|uniref:Uncharacterized protein n=1 Tax=Helobdella robusta TaxID=6412 RepID=T1EUJ7_HELRO|nr:hypothetical protein HELRODRAFT_163861 [Helobdella robusta]ESN96749.1 hypothetical protein HELRODRAFT_163861 [Helobdella robusta]